MITPWKSSPILETFFQWLISPDAKAKPARQAEQHVKQVMVILKAGSDNTFEFQPLFDRKCVRDKWLLPFENTDRLPATVKAYVTSLRCFYMFVVHDEPEALKEYVHKCASLNVTCTDWIALYRKKQKKGRWKKDLEQLTQLFNASDMKQLDESEIVAFCKETLKSVRFKEIAPSLRQFSNVRDYILLYLCFDNASRTGALANMTLREFNSSSFIDGSYRINVFDHKTVTTSGPACIVVTYDLYLDMCTYVQKIRNKLDGIDAGKNSNVFVSWSGSKMSSSMVTAQINSFWGKAVGHTENRPHVSANLVRKSAVSKVHSTRKDMKEDLANLMCHSVTTAGRIYYLQNKPKKAGETSAALRDLQRQQDPEDDLEDSIRNHFHEDIKKGKITLMIVPEKKSLSPAFENISDICLRDKVRYVISKDMASQFESNVAESDTDESDEENSTDLPQWKTKGRKERVVFTNHDITRIYLHFQPLITADRSLKIRMKEFKSLVEKREIEDILIKYGEETLLSKVRTERKNFLQNKKRKTGTLKD